MRFPTLLAAVLLLATVAPGRAANPSFHSAYTGYTTYRLPSSATRGDFNGDGVVDFAVVSSSFSIAAIHLGQGDGSFAAPETLALSSGAWTLTAGDFDGDGRDDLVTFFSLGGWDSLGVHLRQPSGGFGPHNSIGTGKAPVVADLTGDGKRDIAAIDNVSHVKLYPGDGAGGFGAALDVPFTDAINLIYAHDVNHDGLVDLVAETVDGIGGVWYVTRFNLGAGAFGPEVSSASASPMYGTGELVDFDEDGAADLMIADGYVKGHTDGTFGGTVPFTTTFGLGWPGDVDGDGHLDMVFLTIDATYAACYLQVCRGHGDGTIDAPVAYPEMFDIWWVCVDDLNRDGRADVTTISYNQSRLSVHVSSPAGGFGNALSYAAGTNPLAVALGDVTGDGRRDVVVADNGGPALRVHPGIGGGRLGAATVLTAPADVKAVAIGDLDGDGLRDLVSGNGGSNSVSVWRASGAGTFAPRVDYACPGAVTRITTGDLNGDGYHDVVALQGATLSVWLSSASGALGARVDRALAESEAAIAITPVNGDAYPDVIVQGVGRVSYLPGSATGALGTRVDNTVTGPSGTIPFGCFGDVNGDGFVDAVLTNNTSSTLFVRVGNGTGGFTALPSRAGEKRGAGPALGDVDEDGKLDLVAAALFAGSASVLRGNGDGTFDLTLANFGSGAYALETQLADMDDDGHLDIVCPNQGSQTISVLLNRTPGLASVTPAPAAAAAGLRFSRVGPVPSRDGVRVSFALPSRGRAALELIDVAGRSMGRQELGVLEAGTHHADFARGATARPGVYWLRLSHGGRTASARVVFVN